MEETKDLEWEFWSTLEEEWGELPATYSLHNGFCIELSKGMMQVRSPTGRVIAIYQRKDSL